MKWLTSVKTRLKWTKHINNSVLYAERGRKCHIKCPQHFWTLEIIDDLLAGFGTDGFGQALSLWSQSGPISSYRYHKRCGSSPGSGSMSRSLSGSIASFFKTEISTSWSSACCLAKIIPGRTDVILQLVKTNYKNDKNYFHI